MSLRTQAAADFEAIVEDAAGFGWPITVTDPGGTAASLTGLSNDIHLSIDQETGQMVSGRSVSVALSIASLTAVGLGIPKGIADTAGKPWLVEFDDLAGATYTFKVTEAMPDRAIGAVVCTLEFYKH